MSAYAPPVPPVIVDPVAPVIPLLPAVGVEPLEPDESTEDEADDYTPSPVTVYNDPAVSNATIWITGAGLSQTDMLVTQRNPDGETFDKMRAFSGSNEVEGAYDIYLRSGRKNSGSAMNLTFNLDKKYAGQDFTLIHNLQKGTYEYFYDTANANGELTFGPLYELSPFMLVMGTLEPETDNAEATPANGGARPLLWLGLALLAAAGLATVFILRRKRRLG